MMGIQDGVVFAGVEGLRFEISELAPRHRERNAQRAVIGRPRVVRGQAATGLLGSRVMPLRALMGCSPRFGV